MTVYEEIGALCDNAAEAAAKLALCDTDKKNSVLLSIADKIEADTEAIIAENEKDLQLAAENGVPQTMLDRLKLTDTRIHGICDAVRDVVALDDPVGKGETWTRPSGIEINRIRVPLGVVAMIYEARPNVTVDSAALCLKTGNAVVLRGGKEAINTNKALVSSIKNSCQYAA